jgi:hypothetical protein
MRYCSTRHDCDVSIFHSVQLSTQKSNGPLQPPGKRFALKLGDRNSGVFKRTHKGFDLAFNLYRFEVMAKFVPQSVQFLCLVQYIL